MSAAPSTTLVLGFVDHTALAARRRCESIAGLTEIGVAGGQQIYTGITRPSRHNALLSTRYLPPNGEGLRDTELTGKEMLIGTFLANQVLERNLHALVTLGESHDPQTDPLYHPDHDASHRAALIAQALLHEAGRAVDIYALDHHYNGRPVIRPSRAIGQRILWAAAHHPTQMPLQIGEGGVIEPIPEHETAWLTFLDGHGRLLAGEQTFQLLPASRLDTMGRLSLQRLVEVGQ